MHPLLCLPNSGVTEANLSHLANSMSISSHTSVLELSNTSQLHGGHFPPLPNRPDILHVIPTSSFSYCIEWIGSPTVPTQIGNRVKQQR
jgi:hypothetical protein